jgi:hypothetical protein
MDSPEKLTFGSYEVLQNPDGTPCLLGQGSFGATYKARHVLLGRIKQPLFPRPSVRPPSLATALTSKANS